MTRRNLSLFESERLTMQDAIDLTRQSLIAYGATYRHWAIAFSGGKDSSATVTLIAHLIEAGQVPAPDSLTVLYADTRMELPPLQISAKGVLAELERRGIKTQVVLPALDDRFFVYIFGRGVTPPKNRFRWCTPQLKVEPMLNALQALRAEAGEKILMLTGVRLGESAVRDERIALSCGKDGAECGQGWFQKTTPAAIADTLAPCLHWRVCHVWDWLTFNAPSLGYPTQAVAEAYGGDEAEERNARTGCVGCNLASKDVALDNILRLPHWRYLQPFKRLKPLYAELTQHQNRLQKDGNERRKDGSLSKNPGRKGPLTMEARRYGLDVVLGIQDEINRAARAQGRPEVSLINTEELARIEELIAANTWPQGWSGDEPNGGLLMAQTLAEGITQPLLVALEGM
jgi:DNA sulfur modification protein DndC